MSETAPTSATDQKVTFRYFAAAEEAAGLDQEQLPVPTGATLADLLALIGDRHPPLTAVLPACSYLVDEVTADPTRPVTAGAVVDVLPPFAGG